MAMGLTGSREAIPILIELLKHPDPETSWRAYYSLYELTHRSDPLESQDNFHADAQYAKWSEWWTTAMARPLRSSRLRTVWKDRQ